MSANEVTEKLLEELGETDLVILNFANGDMVGHTGVLEAAIKAVETVDKNLKLIYDKVIELDGTLIVTADHGNCELMIDENDNVITSHTTNKVPFIICNENYQVKEGKLTSKEAKRYIAGHLGYIQIANVKNLKDKLFYIE